MVMANMLTCSVHLVPLPPGREHLIWLKCQSKSHKKKIQVKHSTASHILLALIIYILWISAGVENIHNFGFKQKPNIGGQQPLNFA